MFDSGCECFEEREGREGSERERRAEMGRER